MYPNNVSPYQKNYFQNFVFFKLLFFFYILCPFQLWPVMTLSNFSPYLLAIFPFLNPVMSCIYKSLLVNYLPTFLSHSYRQCVLFHKFSKASFHMCPTNIKYSFLILCKTLYFVPIFIKPSSLHKCSVFGHLSVLPQNRNSVAGIIIPHRTNSDRNKTGSF